MWLKHSFLLLVFLQEVSTCGLQGPAGTPGVLGGEGGFSPGDAPAPAPAPAPGPGFTGGRRRRLRRETCFHGDQPVVLANGGVKPVKQLRLGDRVFAFSPEQGVHVSQIKEFSLRRPTEQRVIWRLETARGWVDLTGEHAVLVSDCAGSVWSKKRAGSVRVGECVPGVDPSGRLLSEPLTRITSRVDVGVFRPITQTGTLVANNITVSCFDVKSEELEDAKEKIDFINW